MESITKPHQIKNGSNIYRLSSLYRLRFCYRFSIAVFPKCVLQMFWSIIFPRQHQSSPREPFPKNQRYNLLRCTLTCRPSSREILSKVVSGGLLAGVAVLQASWASLNSKAGE